MTNRWPDAGRMKRQKNNVALAQPNDEGKSCSKFG